MVAERFNKDESIDFRGNLVFLGQGFGDNLEVKDNSGSVGEMMISSMR